MLRKQKRFSKRKKQFRSVYCISCKQQKSCGQLDEQKKYCCVCYSREILAELEKDELLINSTQQTLNDYRLGIIACQCSGAEKPRLKYISSDGSGWINCESKECKKTVASAGHHGVIKNRNNPSFWGLKVKEKVLCGECLEARKKDMKPLWRAEFNRYRKVGRL